MEGIIAEPRIEPATSYSQEQDLNELLGLAQPRIDHTAPSVGGFGACRTDWHVPSYTCCCCFNCPCALGD